MYRRLGQIPWSALRCFEAAARLGSFRAAADELGVSPSAISLQVRRLEDRFGRPLFVRGHRVVTLTPLGASLAPGLKGAFGEIESLLSQVVEPASAALRISALPSFAAKWLASRLPQFAVAYPAFDIRLVGEDELADFDDNDVDIGLRYGRGDYAGLRSEKVCDVFAVPVCSSAFAREHRNALRTPEGVKELPLLCDELGQMAPDLPTWSKWFELANVDAPKPIRGPRFESQHLALEAAVAGRGIALGLSPLVDGDLASGRLIRLFDITVPSPFSFWCVCREDRAKERKIAAFFLWMKDQFAQEQQGR